MSQSLGISIWDGAIMDNHTLSQPKTIKRNILSIIKWLIGCIYLAIGAPGHRSELIVFVFHEVCDNPREHPRLTRTYSTNKIFSKQISLLSTNFRFINPLADPQWLNKAGCLITFDDGYKGSLAAARKLDAMGISSIHFINLDTIHGQINSSALLHFISLHSGKDIKWHDSNPTRFAALLSGLSNSQLEDLDQFSGPYMDPSELAELISLPQTLIGDHLLNHWHINSLTQNEFLQNLSKLSNKFSEIPKMKYYFAAPHGQMDLERVKLVSNKNYEVIFSGFSRVRVGNAQVIPRIDMNNSINSKPSLFGAIAISLIRGKISARN
jgi:hypothetical protein